MVVTMERLSTLTCDLPEKLQEDNPILNWPRSSAFEVDRLIANFSRMADSLGYQFALVKENNASLENRVAERTDELLESRNLFRTLADYAPVGIFQTNALGACIFVNKKWCQLTGLSEQQALGQGWISALHPEDRQRVVDVWYGAVAGKEEFQAEYRFLHADAQVVFVQGNAVEVYREETGAQHYIGCVVDITERKKAMEEVSQAKETAIAADQAKSRLLRTVAHEFRTPLSLLVSSLDILDRYGKNLGEEQRLTQEKYIRSASSQLSELVNAVSSYNQKEVAQQLESWTMEKISTLCRTVGEEIAAGWSVDHRLQLSFSPEQGGVDMNEPLFRRIFGNLLLNFSSTVAGVTLLHRTI
jgi:PAS domain S-box-containing protein